MKKVRKKPTVVAVSGGFDPLHIGHIRLFKEAKKLGDKLVVILNNDNWIKKKKRFVFMPQQERTELIKALSSVDDVVLTSHSKNPKDMSVSKELKKLRPDIFANGGDRTKKNIPEVAVCKRLNRKMIFNIGHGGKIQSSSWLLDKYATQPKNKSIQYPQHHKTYRPWGYFAVIEEGKNFKVKKVFVEPGQKLSLQLHKQRSEHWVVLEGRARVELNNKIFVLKNHQSIDIPVSSKHRLENPGPKPLNIIDIQRGDYLSENDIIRFEDKYGRI